MGEISEEKALTLAGGGGVFRLVFGERAKAGGCSTIWKKRVQAKLNAAIDSLNVRFGKHAAYFGGAHRALDHGKLAIAFNHIPDVETEK